MVNVEQLRIDHIVGQVIPHSFNVKDLSSFASDNSNILLGIGTVFGLLVILLVIRRIFLIKSAIKQQSVLLELTPPAITEKTSYTTQQLFLVIHNLGEHKTFIDRLLGHKNLFSFEIVSTKDKGIRYLIRTTADEAGNIKRNLLSYLSQVKVEEVSEYLPESINTRVVEYKLRKQFAYPLQAQDILKEHDPVAYITGMMTKLSKDELVSFQIVIAPVRSREAQNIKTRILQGEDALKYINRIIKLPSISLFKPSSALTKRVINRSQQELIESIEQKVNQPLFETKIRLLVSVNDKSDYRERVKGFTSSLAVYSFSAYQSIQRKRNINLKIVNTLLFFNFKKRLLSIFSNSSPYLLSVSEISDLYHFPYTLVTKTENIVKVHSRQLPAPLSLKRTGGLDIEFADNNYGGSITKIGLTEDERRRHMYILGATGTGKSTLLLSMIAQDMKNGKGICVIDPHGDLAEKILPLVPANRIKDIIYFNPDDVSHPIGINLLELTEGLSEEDSLREKEFITESIISLFHKLYPEKYSGPRMEYILRNTIHTAFSFEAPTFFTIYKLLTNTVFRKSVVAKLTDENLKDFWKYEFSKAGDYQKVKMISPITNKIGRFLFSATAKRILEQEKSSINFDDILDNGKILICNLSKGRIGEDTSEVFGILVMTKIQLAALKRARVDISKRRDFYLYVDEFQNFATPSFAQILSEARKYRLNAILAHQTISQLEDKSLVNITLANTGTVICFRTANPEDEKMILPQFLPYIEQGEIANLPSYNFYIKINAINPEESFSGQTIPVDVIYDKRKVEKIIESSQKLYAKTVSVRSENAKSKEEQITKQATKDTPETITQYA